MQWNLNIATHLSVEAHPEIDIGAVLLEASSRMQEALEAAFGGRVNVCISFDPTGAPKNISMSEEVRLRCEGIEEGVMSSIRTMFDL